MGADNHKTGTGSFEAVRISPRAARRITNASFAGTARQPGRIHLTPREFEVLSLLAEGLSNKLICRRLDISPSTVKIHVARILAELGVSSRLQAVLAAQRLGLLDPAAGTEEPAYSAEAADDHRSQHPAYEPDRFSAG